MPDCGADRAECQWYATMPLFRRKPDKPQERSQASPGAARRGSSALAQRGSPNGLLPPPSSSAVDGPSSHDPAEEPPAAPFLQAAEEEYEPQLCMRTKSRLSKTLEEALHDAGALAYLIQFAEEQGTRPLVKFWMEAQSFHASCLLRRTSPAATLNGDEGKGPGERSAGDCPHAGHTDSAGGVASKRTPHGECASSADTVLLPPSPAAGPLGNGHRKGPSPDRNPYRKGPSQRLSSNPLDPPKAGGSSRRCGDPLRATSAAETPEVSPVRSADSPRPPGSAQGMAATDESALAALCGAVRGSGGDGREQVGALEAANSRTQFACNLNGGPPGTPPSARKGTDSDAPGDLDATLRPTGGGRRDSLSQDALHIFNTYIAQNAPLPIGVSDDLRRRLQESVSRNPVEPDCFFEAQQFAVSQMEKEVYPHFLRSPYHCKHQVDVLTSGSVSLADILYNDSALFYFMEFMEQEQCRHLVDFLLMADNFRSHLLAEAAHDPVQAQDDAMVIYDKYFSLQATSPLGFSDAVRLEVEQNICRDQGPLPSCFDRPVMVLLQHLEKNHLKAFLSSQLYVKYISECIVTIQTAQSDTDSLQRKKRSGSDSSSSDLSSLASLSTPNTLLAMDGKQPGTPGARRLLRHIEGSDMKIDSGQFNPDALWKRSLAGRLQMAHIDHLGKVTTEFEPEPDKKTGSLTKALRKLVNWDADKTEEDMAWQVAEMIVKDICSVTLCPSEQDNG